MKNLLGIKDCAKIYAEKAEVSVAEAERQLKTAVDTMREAIVEHGGFRFIGDFSIEVVERKERVGRNPKNPQEEIVIPARNALKLTTGKGLKEAIN